MINQSILSIERSISTQVDKTAVAASGFYPLSNPSGFITGVDTTNFYTNDNPSGYITGIENLVYTAGNQTISGIKTFANNVTVLGDFAVSGTTFINQVIDVTTTGIISGITGVFQHLQADNILYSQTDSYVVAKAGDDLMLKYAEAAALTPNASVKTSYNRATLVLFPGEYPTNSEPVFNIDFVDVIALGSSEKKPSVFIEDSSISVTANDVRVIGISTKGQPFKVSSSSSSQVFENCSGGNNSFGYSDGSSSIFLEGTYINCTAGDNSFCHMVSGNDATIHGNLINCSAGDNSFGYTGGGGTLEVSGNFEKCSGNDNCFNSDFGINSIGTYKDCTAGINSFTAGSSIHIRCTAGNDSFGGDGTYEDCSAGNDSFGGVGASYINCTGGNGSFGSEEASGTFVNCVGGDNSFASGGIIYGNATFTNCTGGANSFAGGVGSGSDARGVFIGCTGGILSFGGYGTASGIFKNCVALNGSFGTQATGSFTDCQSGSHSWAGEGGICSGTFLRCTGGGTRCFNGEASGSFTDCKAGSESFGSYYGSVASGTFINCTGGNLSFGGNTVVSGTLTNCRLAAGTFQVLTAPATGNATMINCIDGNGDIINGEVSAE